MQTNRFVKFSCYTHVPASVLLLTYIQCHVTVIFLDSCNYKLEKEDLCVSQLFEMFDSVKVEIGILDWGVKMTTLEDGKLS